MLTCAPRTSLRFLSSGAISSGISAASSKIPSSRYPLEARTCLCQSSFKGLETLEDKQHLGCYPGDQQKAAGRYSQHDKRPEMMILRLPAQWAFFFHGGGRLLRLLQFLKQSSQRSD